jgi:hypothetical protein
VFVEVGQFLRATSARAAPAEPCDFHVCQYRHQPGGMARCGRPGGQMSLIAASCLSARARPAGPDRGARPYALTAAAVRVCDKPLIVQDASTHSSPSAPPEVTGQLHDALAVGEVTTAVDGPIQPVKDHPETCPLTMGAAGYMAGGVREDGNGQSTWTLEAA